MPNHTISTTFKDDAGSVPIGGTNYIVAEEVNELLHVPAGSVNLAFAIEFLHAKVHDYCISLGVQTAAQALTDTYSEASAGSILLNVNSTSSPAPALTINAKQPHVFAPCVPGTVNEFTADVTNFFCNNAGSTDLVLCVKIGLNT